jgi:hypothetical protein
MREIHWKVPLDTFDRYPDSSLSRAATQRFANSSQPTQNAAPVAKLLRWNLCEHWCAGSKTALQKQNPASDIAGLFLEFKSRAESAIS